MIGQNDVCGWSVTASGGVPPFSYWWSAEYSSPSTGFTFTTGNSTATVSGWGYYYELYPEYTTVTLKVLITDAEGQELIVQRPVTLYGYSFGCS
jgi:hypothetical protein